MKNREFPTDETIETSMIVDGKSITNIFKDQVNGRVDGEGEEEVGLFCGCHTEGQNDSQTRDLKITCNKIGIMNQILKGLSSLGPTIKHS